MLTLTVFLYLNYAISRAETFFLQKLENDVQIKIENLEGFKFVLTTITTITRMSITAELTYRDVQERYRTLKGHKVSVSTFHFQ